MPTKNRRENKIIELFVSGYERGKWKGATVTFPDEQEDGKIDGFVKGAGDATLAIEHTVVEPFVGDLRDQSEFIPEFLALENDKSLVVPGRWIQLFVPVGTLHLQKRLIRDSILRSVGDWLRANGLSLPEGQSEHICPVVDIPGGTNLSLTLTVKVVQLEGDGTLHIRRQQTEDTLGEVVEKMLHKKLPKLVATVASKRVLLLERHHLKLLPEAICSEIESRRERFPALADVHEIWIVEKLPFFQAREGDAHFELYQGGGLVRSFTFQNGKLTGYSEAGTVSHFPQTCSTTS